MRMKSLPERYRRKRLTFILAGCCMALLCMREPLLAQEEKRAVIHRADKLPSAYELKGWEMQGDPYVYDASTLYQYIDGAADQFILYGFKKLQGAEFINTTDAQESLIVDVYDMGSDLSAFGIFMSKKDPTSSVLKIGTEAFGNDQYVVFYKDRFYVEIQVRIRSEKSRPMPQLVARLVAQKISGSLRPPKLLRIFPDANRVPGSENYLVGGILGHAFLPQGVVSEYRIAGETVKSFIIPFPSPSAARTAFECYQQFIASQGTLVRVEKTVGDGSFSGQDPYHKTVIVARQGGFIAAITELSSPEQGAQILSTIIRNLKKIKKAPAAHEPPA